MRQSSENPWNTLTSIKLTFSVIFYNTLWRRSWYHFTCGSGCPWNLQRNRPTVPSYATVLASSTTTWGRWSGSSVSNTHCLHIVSSSSILLDHTRSQNTRVIGHCRPPSTRIRSGAGVQIMTPDPDHFQNLTGTSEDTSMIKFSRRSDQFFKRYEPNVEKLSHLWMLKNPLKKSWIQIWTRMMFKI